MEFAETIRSAWSADRADSIFERWTKKLISLFAPAFQGMSRTRKSRTLVVEERISLGPKKTLMLISCRGQSFLVASGAEEISAILPLVDTARRPSAPATRLRVRSGRSWK